MKLVALVALVAAAAVLAAGCGESRPKRVPNVVGERLDVAQARLDDLDLGYKVLGGGTFGVVVRSHWTVCRQRPPAGRKARSVELVVERSCGLEPREVPDVTGESLEDAEEELEARGIAYTVITDGEEVVVKHFWEVCSQDPWYGRARRVKLYVEHDCWDD